MKDKIDDAITIICFVILAITVVILWDRADKQDDRIDTLQALISLHGDMMKSEGVEYR